MRRPETDDREDGRDNRVEPRRTECLTDDEVLRYTSGALSPELEAAIRGHLYECSSCCVLVAEAVRSVHTERTRDRSTSPTAASQPLALTLKPGERLLERYRVVRFVARGGMGEVYEARDDVLNETVALKTLVCTALDNSVAMNRFLAEVRTARQVTHPNICRILEFGFHKPSSAGTTAQVPFLTMEFLAGETLDRRIARKGKLLSSEVAALLPQIVAGVGAIHAAGIVHRDIKPANIVILPGAPERVVVTDFGLASVLDPTSTRALDAGPLIAGTLDYMAPEQIGGRPPTRRFDVYAMGVVIFEMLTGRRPFAAGHPASSSERMNRLPPRPSAYAPYLDAGWDALVARCLAAHPEHRFEGVHEIVAPSLTGPSWWRRRAPIGMAALVVVLFFGWMMYRVRRILEPPVTTSAAMPDPTHRPSGMPAARPLLRSVGPNGCAADMVSVNGRFCVDRYEATVVDDVLERPIHAFYPPWAPLARDVHRDWTERVRQGKAGNPVALPPIPAYQLEDGWLPRAVSRPQATPQGYVNKVVAQAACLGADKRLCKEGEWRTACRGERDTRFPYGDGYKPDACNIRREVHPAVVLHGVVHEGMLKDPRLNAVGTAGKMLLHQTGGLPECRSPWGDDGVYDMVGNLDEWVEAPEPVYRGGYYSRATDEGCEYRNDRHKQEGPTYYNYSIGFRCCADLRSSDGSAAGVGGSVGVADPTER